MLGLLARLIRDRTRRQVVSLLATAVAAIFLGAWAFSVTQHEGYLTSVYWAITTATTVGYGDITPKNGIGRIVAVAVMLTTIPLFGAVFALVAGASALSHLRRLLGMDHRLPEPPYRLVVGTSPTALRITEDLARSETRVVLVADVDDDRVPEHVHLVKGDPTLEAILRRARPASADQALVTGPDDASLLMSAVLLRALAPQLEVAALTHSSSVAEALRDLGITRTVCSDDLLAHTMAKTLESPHAGDLLIKMVDSDDYELREVPVPGEWSGRALSEVRSGLGGVVLGLVTQGTVVLGAGRDPTVGADDSLLVLEPTPDRHRV